VSAPRLSIIIVTHNSHQVLDRCLAALPEAVGAWEWELIVVDNASDETMEPIVRGRFPQALYLSCVQNTGFAAACNLASKDAAGEFLCFLNPDVIADPDSLATLCQVAARDIKIGAVGARLRFPDGAFQATCRKFPNVFNILFSRGSVLSRLVPGARVYTLSDCSELTRVPALAATMMVIRRGLFHRVRGFDNRFFMYMEDTDLCYRLHRRGYTNLFVPAAGGVHAWATGSSAGRVRRAWLHHQSVWKYFLKHLPNGFSVLILPVLLSFNLLLTVVFGRRQKSSPPTGESR